MVVEHLIYYIYFVVLARRCTGKTLVFSLMDIFVFGHPIKQNINYWLHINTFTVIVSLKIDFDGKITITRKKNAEIDEGIIVGA